MRCAALLLALLVPALAACGGGSHTSAPATTTTAKAAAPSRVSFAGATARTLATGSAQVTSTILADFGGQTVTAAENGRLSFSVRRAHLYKIVPGSDLPREVVIVGQIEYTNANVQAAMNDPSVPPWTKLDLTKLTAKERAAQADEIAHVLAPVYLAEGVATPVRRGPRRFTGTVDPALLGKRLPAALRAEILGAVRGDYRLTPFPASFSLDAHGRISRVVVDYTTAQGSRIRVDTGYGAFGTSIPLGLPPVTEIKDITPS